MSKVAIQGNASGTGTFTVAAPNSNNNQTLTLPDQTATIATLTTPSFATTIGVGGATASASGAGISFPATQSASTDANTLDDYEEGTWTPAVYGSTSAGTASYSNRVARYVKIGRLVWVDCYIDWSGGNGTGSLRISGLPFTTASTGNSYCSFAISEIDSITMTASNYASGCGTQPNQTNVFFRQQPVGGGATSAIAYDGAGYVIFGGCYLADA